MLEHTLIIPLVVPQFFPTPHNENKLEPRFDAAISIDVEAPTSYDCLGIDERMVEDESIYLHPSFDKSHASELLGGSIVSDSYS